MRDHLDRSRPVSLYVHVPFCSTKCGYCAFYSIPEKDRAERDIDRYFGLISRQAAAVAQEVGKPFRTVYIGGGNPGILGPERLSRLLDTILSNGMPEEVSMEINPETLSPGFRKLCGKVTRFSVGIQSFNETHLSTLQRNASSGDCRKALDLLSEWRRDEGVTFNADLMTNIPRQTLQEALEDIEELSEWGPDHISLYNLTFEEGTALIGKESPKPQEEEAENLFALWDRLESLGWGQYEVSAFAREGRRCLHNLNYWELGQYIGIGPSAESSVGWDRIVSSREADTLEGWLSNPSFKSEALTAPEAAEEWLICRLRTRGGCRKAELFERFGFDWDQTFREALSGLDPKLYNDDGQFFSLTRDGLMLTNQVLLELALCLPG